MRENNFKLARMRVYMLAHAQNEWTEKTQQRARVGQRMETKESPPDSSQFAASIVPICSKSKKTLDGEELPQESYPLEALLRRFSLPYNPLLDSSNRSYLTAPGVVQHLIKQGFLDQVK